MTWAQVRQDRWQQASPPGLLHPSTATLQSAAAGVPSLLSGPGAANVSAFQPAGPACTSHVARLPPSKTPEPMLLLLPRLLLVLLVQVRRARTARSLTASILRPGGPHSTPACATRWRALAPRSAARAAPAARPPWWPSPASASTWSCSTWARGAKTGKCQQPDMHALNICTQQWLSFPPAIPWPPTEAASRCFLAPQPDALPLLALPACCHQRCVWLSLRPSRLHSA